MTDLVIGGTTRLTTLGAGPGSQQNRAYISGLTSYLLGMFGHDPFILGDMSSGSGFVVTVVAINPGVSLTIDVFVPAGTAVDSIQGITVSYGSANPPNIPQYLFSVGRVIVPPAPPPGPGPPSC